MGYTRNMGNFESARVDIGIEDDLRVNEGIHEGYTRVSKLVEGKLIDQVRELEDEVKSVKADGSGKN